MIEPQNMVKPTKQLQNRNSILCVYMLQYIWVLSIADSGSPFGLYEKSYKLPAFRRDAYEGSHKKGQYFVGNNE